MHFFLNNVTKLLQNFYILIFVIILCKNEISKHKDFRRTTNASSNCITYITLVGKAVNKWQKLIKMLLISWCNCWTNIFKARFFSHKLWTNFTMHLSLYVVICGWLRISSNRSPYIGYRQKNIRAEVKVKLALEQAMKAYRESRGIALLFLWPRR